MITRMDTNQVDKIGSNLVKLASELDSEFDSLYKRLENVPRGTKEWIGNQADYYFSRVALEKRQYVDFVSKIRSIGEELCSEASSVQHRISVNNEKIK